VGFRARFATIAVLVVCGGMSGALALTAGAHAASGPLQTAVLDDAAFSGTDADLAFQHTADAGATAARISLNWNRTAPSEPTDANDFSSSGYDWSVFDREVALASVHGVEPIANIVTAPSWALVAPGLAAPATVPDPTRLAQFALAAASRYNGLVQGLPRVRYWSVWNEPNLSPDLAPQFFGGLPFAPGWYRQMVNAVAGSVKSVAADNMVIAGETAPFRDLTPAVLTIDPDWGPLSFMRNLLCLSPSLTPTCSTPVKFDIWAHHPYGSGGPDHHAAFANDVSVPDLPAMTRLLDAAYAAGHIAAPSPPQLWATEFSWDTDPPDSRGVPMALATRWTAEALYRMWSYGVSQVTWLLLRDQPPSDPYQSGLYFRGPSLAQDQPKDLLAAFRFPFVAYPRGANVTTWGRVPRGAPGVSVLVEQQTQTPLGWVPLGTLTSNANGIVTGLFPRHGMGAVRASSTNAQSPPFGLRPVLDRTFPPFGGPVLEPPPAAAPRPSVPPRPSSGPRPGGPSRPQPR
jgi:hypothetical protein